MSRPVYQQDLDRLADQGCSIPGCKHDHDGTIFLHGRCHPGGRLEVKYVKNSGVLTVNCLECGKRVASIAVAKEDKP